MDMLVPLTLVVGWVIGELLPYVLTRKAPFWLSRGIVSGLGRLWHEQVILGDDILRNRSRFGRWRPETARYVALRAIKAQSTDDDLSQPALDLLESYLKRHEAVVLLGQPGSGKTTALEALTYRLARRAYRHDVLVWFGLLSVATSLLFVAPSLALAWLAVFTLWEPFARRAIIPLYLEPKSDYDGKQVADWCVSELKKRALDKRPWGIRYRVVYLVGAVTEVVAQAQIDVTPAKPIYVYRAAPHNMREHRQILQRARIPCYQSTLSTVRIAAAICQYAMHSVATGD